MRTQGQRLRGDFGGESGGGGANTPVAKGAYFSGTDNDPIQGDFGWIIIAEFDLDVMPVSAILDGIMLVSDVALTGRLKLFDVTGVIDVPGSTLATVSLTGERLTSGDLVASLVVGRRYQIQAECTGGGGNSNWAVVRYATLVPLP